MNKMKNYLHSAGAYGNKLICILWKLLFRKIRYKQLPVEQWVSENRKAIFDWRFNVFFNKSLQGFKHIVLNATISS